MSSDVCPLLALAAQFLALVALLSASLLLEVFLVFLAGYLAEGLSAALGVARLAEVYLAEAESALVLVAGGAEPPLQPEEAS